MKNLICVLLCLLVFPLCNSQPTEVEKRVEHGVEVVVNHLKPYNIEGEPSTLLLEEEFTIDSERDETADIGLTDIWNFDIDSEGNIYLLHLQSKENCIFKFNSKGDFLVSFGRKGQGPGELQYPLLLQVRNKELAVSDPTKVVFFSEDGKFLKEISKESNKLSFIYLENENCLVRERIRGASDGATQHVVLVLYDSEFNKIKEISRVTRHNPLKGKGFRAIMPYSHAHISQGKIFEGNSERGYVIFIYDLSGNLIKKIIKEYIPVPVTSEDKDGILKLYERMPEEIKKTIYFPESYPPFQRLFFTDDDGRLFVMTYEKGKNTREYIYDIFNSEGAFVGRIGFDNYGQTGVQSVPLPAVSKNNRLYYIREKDSGFKELAVFKMIWQ